jgi:hypothetical protein
MKDNAEQSYSCQAKGGLLALLLLVAVGYSVNGYFNQGDNNFTPVVAFQFDTYCAINNLRAYNLINAELAAKGLSPLRFDYSLNSYIYVVYVQANPSNASDPNSEANLFYCGIARKWTETNCNNARFVCSTPGPMFDFKVRE